MRLHVNLDSQKKSQTRYTNIETLYYSNNTYPLELDLYIIIMANDYKERHDV